MSSDSFGIAGKEYLPTRKKAIGLEQETCELTRNRGRPSMDTVDERGQRLRAKRIALGLTMAEVADAAGISEGTISRLEAGRMPNASFNLVISVLRVLNMAVEDLQEAHAVLA